MEEKKKASKTLKKFLKKTLNEEDKRNDIILSFVLLGLFYSLSKGLLNENIFYSSIKWISSLVVVDTGVKRIKEATTDYIDKKIKK